MAPIHDERKCKQELASPEVGLRRHASECLHNAFSAQLCDLATQLAAGNRAVGEDAVQSVFATLHMKPRQVDDSLLGYLCGAVRNSVANIQNENAPYCQMDENFEHDATGIQCRIRARSHAKDDGRRDLLPPAERICLLEDVRAGSTTAVATAFDLARDAVLVKYISLRSPNHVTTEALIESVRDGLLRRIHCCGESIVGWVLREARRNLGDETRNHPERHLLRMLEEGSLESCMHSREVLGFEDEALATFQRTLELLDADSREIWMLCYFQKRYQYEAAEVVEWLCPEDLPEPGTKAWHESTRSSIERVASVLADFGRITGIPDISGTRKRQRTS